jgi:chromosome segregation ATPase
MIIVELNSKIDQLEKNLSDTQGELNIKNSHLEKSTVLLAELQAVNGKLESLLKHITAEKTKMEGELGSAV